MTIDLNPEEARLLARAQDALAQLTGYQMRLEQVTQKTSGRVPEALRSSLLSARLFTKALNTGIDNLVAGHGSGKLELDVDDVLSRTDNWERLLDRKEQELRRLGGVSG